MNHDSNIIESLPLELITKCISFLPGNYIFIASTCKIFREASQKISPPKAKFFQSCSFKDYNDIMVTLSVKFHSGKHMTTMEAVLSSLSCLQMYLQLQNEEQQDLVQIYKQQRHLSSDTDSYSYDAIEIESYKRNLQLKMFQRIARAMGCYDHSIQFYTFFQSCLPFYFHDRRKEYGTKTWMHCAKSACYFGNLKLLHQLLQANKLPYDRTLCNYAAGGSHLNIVKWFMDNNLPVNHQRICSIAAMDGNIQMVQYLHDQKEYRDWQDINSTDACNCASKNGHLNVLKYLHEKCHPWDERTFTYAAKGNHLEIMKYLLEKGCAFNVCTSADAAREGNLEALQWLIAHDCPYIEHEVVYHALNSDKKEMIRWVFERFNLKQTNDDVEGLKQLNL